MNSVQLTIAAYVVYLVLSIGITIWVAKTLFKNGKVFLHDIFHGNQALAESVNNLLLVGFYLVNVGYAVYVLKVTDSITNAQQLLEILSVKVGFIILLLGGMHFFNLFVFFRLRRKAQMITQEALQTTIINQR
jgi:hypothetical protein